MAPKVAEPHVAVAVDLVTLTVADGRLHALVVRRATPPYKGRWALPGGFAETHEDLHTAAGRELAEETSLPPEAVHLEQIRAYGDPKRDPRMRVVSVGHLALVPAAAEVAAGDDAGSARWMQVAELLERPRTLAFDHARILRDGVELLRSRMETTTIATALCPREFTVGELRRVYEAVWETEMDARNFHRKLTGTPGLLAVTRRTTTRHGGRPARLYRRGKVARLEPPITRQG
jgi:8-oxo-dGTP diphosphatase